MFQFPLNGPASEPVSLVEARQWLRIDSSHDDDLVSALIVSARLLVEQTTRRLLLAQTWRIVVDGWPEAATVVLPVAPVSGLLAIRMRDGAGDSTGIDPAGCLLEQHRDPPLVKLAVQPLPLPAGFCGLELDVIAGYGASGVSVPEPLRQAIRMLVTGWYENRGDPAGGPPGVALPPPVAALLAPWRRTRIAR